MINRHMEKSLLKAAGEYLVVILIGPRQSGKTTGAVSGLYSP